MICRLRFIFQKRLQRSSFSRKKISGFTMVETLVALAVLGIFFASLALIIQQILQNVGESRVRETALALAQTKMETVRNLPYVDVGTVGGIPSGAILPTETVALNNQDFIVTTSILYVDDLFDDVAPQDLINTDYKRVRVEITWGGVYPARYPVTLVTNIAPKGIETIAGGGTLFLQVFNAQALPVSGATVTIDNTAVNPQIHMQTLTNSNGLVVIPGAPACIACYQITVTKTNYSTDKTYSTQEVANPLTPLATVIEGQLTQLSFAIDQVSSLIINSLGSRASGYPTVSNVQFTLRGNRIIGYDTNDFPVYKYSFSTNTGGGTVTIPGLEWDTYTLDFSSSGYNLAGSNPPNPLSLSPATNMTVNMVNVPKTNNSLLVIMQDAAQQLLSSASAQLTNLGGGYDASVSAGITGTPDMGQAFFGSLSVANYDLKVTAGGYQEATASVSISGNNQQTVILN